jgi:hypothetical protein
MPWQIFSGTLYLAFFIAAMLSSGSSMVAAEEFRGRISSVDRENTKICFYHDGAKTTGEELLVWRRVVVAAPKFESNIRMRDAEVVQVTKSQFERMRRCNTCPRFRRTV